MECSLDISTVEADAGFTDPDYLDEVANDWLAQDEQSAIDNGLEQLAARLRTKVAELNSKIVN